MRERYRAVLIGCALGDTLGMPVEGWTHEQIAKYVPGGKVIRPMKPFYAIGSNGNLLVEKDEAGGRLKYYSIDRDLGDYTDDTHLTLALAESIAVFGKVNIFDVASRQLAEYLQLKVTEPGKDKGFGPTTLAAFDRLEKGISPLESGVIGGPGNGPAMKIAPNGMLMDASGLVARGTEDAKMISRITHLDPRSVASGVVQSHAVYALFQDVTKKDVIDYLFRVSRENEATVTPQYVRHNRGTLTERLEWVRSNPNATMNQALERLGNRSDVYQSYPFAIFGLMRFWNDPVEGMIELVNCGGDSDTIGAIYGSLVGSKDGMVFPEEWVQVLKNRDRLINAADGIYKIKEHRLAG